MTEPGTALSIIPADRATPPRLADVHYSCGHHLLAAVGETYPRQCPDPSHKDAEQ